MNVFVLQQEGIHTKKKKRIEVRRIQKEESNVLEHGTGGEGLTVAGDGFAVPIRSVSLFRCIQTT